MELVLVRHGPAPARDPRRWPDDRARPLSDAGRQATRKAARGLAEELGRPDRIASSPYLRARATARIVAAAYSEAPTVELWPELASGAPSGPALERLARSAPRDARVVLVGHEPALGGLLGLALTGEEVALGRLGKAGAARIEFSRRVAPGAAELSWILTRRQLAALA